MKYYGLKYTENNVVKIACIEAELGQAGGCYNSYSVIELEIKYYSQEEISKKNHQIFLTTNKEELVSKNIKKLESNEYVFPEYEAYTFEIYTVEVLVG